MRATIGLNCIHGPGTSHEAPLLFLPPETKIAALIKQVRINLLINVPYGGPTDRSLEVNVALQQTSEMLKSFCVNGSGY